MTVTTAQVLAGLKATTVADDRDNLQRLLGGAK